MSTILKALRRLEEEQSGAPRNEPPEAPLPDPPLSGTACNSASVICSIAESGGAPCAVDADCPQDAAQDGPQRCDDGTCRKFIQAAGPAACDPLVPRKTADNS